MNEVSRARFLKMLLTGVAALPAVTATSAGLDGLRGDCVGWARLKTPSPWWKRHAGSDPVLMKFFREQTSLNIDPTWYVADPNALDELCKYPLLFSQGVGVITDPRGRSNLAEYIRRGGFVLVDACHDSRVTPDHDEFFRQQVAFFSATLPESRVVLLPATHEIYRCYFQIPGGEPPHMFTHYGLHGLMIGRRMAGVISLSGLQCAWDLVTENPSPAPPGTELLVMRMLVNIYVYAMLQSG